MRPSTMPGRAARFLVPFTIAATIAAGFALYAWGGIGPSEQELLAIAVTHFGSLTERHVPAASSPLACTRMASAQRAITLPGLPRLQSSAGRAAA